GHRYRSLANVVRNISGDVARPRKQSIKKRRGKKFKRSGKKPMNSEIRNEPKRDAHLFWQFACGHAITGDYLKHKVEKADNDTCWLCGSGQPHPRTCFFERCAAFKEERKKLREDIHKALR